MSEAERRILERARAVSADLLRAQDGLVRAGAADLAASAAILETARARLAELCEALSPARTRPELAQELSGIRRQVARLGALLDSAAAYRAAWIERAAALAGGYRRDGSAGPAPRAPMISLEV